MILIFKNPDLCFEFQMRVVKCSWIHSPTIWPFQAFSHHFRLCCPNSSTVPSSLSSFLVMTSPYQKQANGSSLNTKKQQNKNIQYQRKQKLKNRKMKPPCGHTHVLSGMHKNHRSHWKTKVLSRIYFRVKCKEFSLGSLTPISIPNPSLSGWKWPPTPLDSLGDQSATVLWLKDLRKSCLKYFRRKKCIWNARTEWLTFRFLPLNSLPSRVWDAINCFICSPSQQTHTPTSYSQVDCR